MCLSRRKRRTAREVSKPRGSEGTGSRTRGRAEEGRCAGESDPTGSRRAGGGTAVVRWGWGVRRGEALAGGGLWA